jgi:hypothetical protein
MSLPASGAISMNQVNVELGLGGTTSINLNQATVRTLFGVPSGAISLNDGHGKSSGPPVSGYIGWYDATSWSTSTYIWTDKSGNGNHAQGYTPGGGIQLVAVTGNGSSKTVDAVRMVSTEGAYPYMQWPAGIVPSTYTLFHVCRYTGAAGGGSGRIIQGTSINWLSGFWGGNINSFYHNGWVAYPAAGGTTNWRYSTDQNSLGRQNGVTYGTGGEGSPSYDQICVNNGPYGEASDCDIAEVIVYNTTLNSGQYASVEAYLTSKYGL